MIVGVEEAKEKWCPMARDPIARRGFEEPVCSENGLATCRADQCMMWRQVGGIPCDVRAKCEQNENGEWIEIKKPGPDWEWDNKNYQWFRPYPEKARGYCGLAGRPEE